MSETRIVHLFHLGSDLAKAHRLDVKGSREDKGEEGERVHDQGKMEKEEGRREESSDWDEERASYATWQD